MSIRTKLLLGVALMLVLVLAETGAAFLAIRAQRAPLRKVDHAAETVMTSAKALLLTAKNIQLDVVQVQQFLSDISATRGRGGLNDGFKEAQDYADRFATDVTQANALADALHEPDMKTLLAQTQAAFGPYYATGQRMAHAYVEQGPAGGNPLMPDFDKASDLMQQQVDKLLAAADARTERAATNLRSALGDVRTDGERMVIQDMVVGALAVVAGIALGILCVLLIVRPLAAMIRTVQRLADGDLAVELRGEQHSDEIGALARALRIFRDHMQAAERLAAAQAEARDRAADEKKAALLDMADRVEAETEGALGTIRAQTERMAATAGAMQDSAVRTGAAAQEAAVVSGQALENVQSVASAAEELSASIREILGQVNRSTTVVQSAVAAGGETRGTIERLNQEVGRIGSVTEMISTIAARTNLLALNATIEAARAGDAGKGFAVVASEVKSLANQTAQSTQEIAHHIDQVRAATAASVEAVSRIETTIHEIDAIARSIATAVEQQGQATGEIAQSVAQAAAAADQMTARATEVSDEARETGQRATGVRDDVQGVHDSVQALRHAVIRVVRNATAEVDRRKTPRYRVDLPCQITLGGQTQPVRLMDLSDGGACVQGAPATTPEARGVLAIQGVADRLPVVVRQQAEGLLHLAFDLDAATAERFRGMPERLAQRRAA
jgi:methyl-accepting chemotaxis protein